MYIMYHENQNSHHLHLSARDDDDISLTITHGQWVKCYYQKSPKDLCSQEENEVFEQPPKPRQTPVAVDAAKKTTSI